MINELVGRVLFAHAAAKNDHWAEKSGYRHTVLDAFRGEADDALDALIEAYIGMSDEVPQSEPIGDMPADFCEYLADERDWMAKNRMAITEGDPALDNLLQTLEGVYLATIYKLRRLA